jgi:hypothetical protein
MSTAKRYASTTELKAWLGISDATDDMLLGSVLDDASREIDRITGRHFFETDAGTVRYFTAVNDDELSITDCVTLTAVETDNGADRTYAYTWAVTDYDLLPENAATADEPYTLLAEAPGGSYDFPVGVRKGVKLTGTWGWPAIPAEINRACLLRAAWLFKRKDSPLGVAGNSDLGVVRVGRWDPDFDKLIEPYRLLVVV